MLQNMTVSSFYIPWKQETTGVFFMFLGGEAFITFLKLLEI